MLLIFKISIVYNNKVLETREYKAINRPHAENIAFKYVDSLIFKALAETAYNVKDFNSDDVELFFRDDKRHQVLFEGVA